MMPLNSTKVANQGLSPVPNATSIPIYGNKTRQVSTQDDRNQAGSSKDVLVGGEGLVPHPLNLAEVIKNVLNFIFTLL